MDLKYPLCLYHISVLAQVTSAALCSRDTHHTVDGSACYSPPQHSGRRSVQAPSCINLQSGLELLYVLLLSRVKREYNGLHSPSSLLLSLCPSLFSQSSICLCPITPSISSFPVLWGFSSLECPSPFSLFLPFIFFLRHHLSPDFLPHRLPASSFLHSSSLLLIVAGY